MIGYLVVTGLLALIASWLMLLPVPAGFSAPWRLRFAQGFLDMTWVVAKPVAFLGLGTEVDTLRKIWDAPAKADIKPDPELKIEDTTFDGVKVRTYEPASRAGSDPMPGFVYYHGGGWTLGSIDIADGIARRISKTLGAFVVNVDYRMAPEVVFPVPFEDCVRATKHFLTHAAHFNVDGIRVAVAGDSAGGNLAATVSMKLRDENFSPPIKKQVLIYPVVQGVDFNLPSYQQNANGPVLKLSHMGFYWSMVLTGNSDLQEVILQNKHTPKDVKEVTQASYLNYDWLPKNFLEMAPYQKKPLEDGDQKTWAKIKESLMNPYLSPLFAKDLSSLPDAYVITCQYDLLRDEGFLYAQRMKEFRTKVRHVNYEKGFHALVNFSDKTNPIWFEEGEQLMQELLAYLKEEL